jgi:hypothetical protein
MPYYVNAILNCISEFANIKWDGIVSTLTIVAYIFVKPVICLLVSLSE